MQLNKSTLTALALLGSVGSCLIIGKFITDIPSVVLIVLLSIFLFTFAFLYTNLAMGVLIAAMLLSPQLTFGAISKQQDIMVRIDDLMVVIFTMAWLARSAIIKDQRFIRKFPINRLVFFYMACCFLSTLKGIFVGDVVVLRGFFYVFKYLEYFFVFYLASSAIHDRKQMVLYLKIFIIVFAIVNIYAFSQIGHVDRVSAPFQMKDSEPNTLGGYQVLLFGLILGLLTHTRLGMWKWPLVALIIFGLIPFGFTLSRASYIALIPMYLTLIVFNKFSTKNILIACFIIGLTLLFVIRPENIMNRIQEAFTPEYQENIPTVSFMGISFGASASARINDWVELFHEWTRQPFIGYGLTGTRFVDGQFIKVLVETGLLGLISFLLLLGVLFFQTLKIYRNTKDDLYRGLSIGFLAGQVGMFFHALSTNTYIIIRIMEPFWFLAAMVLVIPYLEKTRPPVKSPKVQPDNYVRNVNFLLNSKWKPSQS